MPDLAVCPIGLCLSPQVEIDLIGILKPGLPLNISISIRLKQNAKQRSEVKLATYASSYAF